MNALVRRAKDVVIHRVLRADDTPHRIAWGVFLGVFVAWTPTLGLQIVIYLALAALLRANKASGIPFLFISNPFTAVPVYLFAWRVGSFLLRGERAEEQDRLSIEERLTQASDAETGSLLDPENLRALWNMLLELGAELWLGGFVVGLLVGIPAYVLSYWGVREYRRRHFPRGT